MPDSKEGKMEVRVSRKPRSALVAGVVLALVFAMPSGAVGKPEPPSIVLGGLAFDCASTAGANVSVSASATVTGGTIQYASLSLSRYGTVSPPYTAFDQVWGVSWYGNHTTYGRTGPVSDSRSVDSAESATWTNAGTVADGQYTGTGWWVAYYRVGALGKPGYANANESQAVYKNCADGTETAEAFLTQFTWIQLK